MHSSCKDPAAAPGRLLHWTGEYHWFKPILVV